MKFSGNLNIHGKTIGKLTAINMVQKRDDRGHLVWNWRCSCNKTIKLSYQRVCDYISRGITPSCNKCKKKK